MHRLGFGLLLGGAVSIGCGPKVGDADGDDSGDASGTTSATQSTDTGSRECDNHSACGPCGYCYAGVCEEEPCCASRPGDDEFRCSEVGDECFQDADCPDGWVCEIGVCIPPEEMDPPTLPPCDQTFELYTVEASLPATAVDLRLWDVDGNGDDEAIVAYLDGTVEVREPLTGEILTQTEALGAAIELHALAAPGDGLVPDLLVVREDGQLVFLPAAPGPAYPQAVPLPIAPVHAATVGDFDGDGVRDAIVLLEATGDDARFTPLWGTFMGLEPSPDAIPLNTATVTLAPHDGDTNERSDFIALRDVEGHTSVQPWWGEADRTFTVAGSRSAPFAPVDVTAGEFAIEPGTEVIAIGGDAANTRIAVFGRDGNSLLEPALYRIDGGPGRVAAGSLSGTGGDDALLLTTAPNLHVIVFDEQGRNACETSLLLPNRGLAVRVGNLDLDTPGLEAYVTGAEASAALVLHGP